MRYVVKSIDDKSDKLKAQSSITEWQKIAKTKNKTLIKDAIYRDPYDTIDGKRSRVEDSLAISYKNKCAYCERLCKADIEHYRPKKAVDDDPEHDGYYWLCYEWSNLIPSCITCNREGGKHNHFPILGKRVTKPTFLEDGGLNFDDCLANSMILQREQACLLHPEVDIPDNYLHFILDPDGEGIRIHGIDIDGRGASTIEICKLNRLELRLDRVSSVIDPFKDSVEAVFGQYSNGDFGDDALLNQLTLQVNILRNQSNKENKTHTLLRRFIVRDVNSFESIILPYIEARCRNLVKQAYIEAVAPAKVSLSI